MSDTGRPGPLVLDLPGQELIMWDGATGTAYTLAHEQYTMSPRTKAVTLALLKLAVAEIEAAA